MVSSAGKSRALIGLMHGAEARIRTRVRHQVKVWTPEEIRALLESTAAPEPPVRPKRQEYYYHEA